MDFIPYNSKKTYHKNPFGATREGESVEFRIVLPRSLRCSGASLIMDSDSGETRVYPMRWEKEQDYGEEWWTVSLAVRKKGLYWYRFAAAGKDGGFMITRAGDGLGRLSSNGSSFQLTVFSKDFKTPDAVKGSTIYQIFPDRFFRSGKKKEGVPKDRILRDDWGGAPMWEPDENGKINEYDFFGGDLKGIEEKLDYIKSLGVGWIYLNPIFEARSNHRYDVADYEKIDPLLGDEKDFEALCASAKEKGIGIILDGVFSHTGADSVYFNKENRYPSAGAYNSKDSPYYDWYKFKKYPDEYDCWWGVDILPEVDEENDSYMEYIAGENGILRKWLRAGASGWRLDVADELPDKFLDALRKAVKSEKPDGYILGEVWEDASNKISYGRRRRYLLGDQLDSVMNYPFADIIIDFAITGRAEGFNDKILEICENYPKAAVDCLMNHIGTHDARRILTRLGDPDGDLGGRTGRRGGLTKERAERGKTLLKLASTIQFTLPGAPCVYYGDEAGLEGGDDPFNRGCYPWGFEDKELIEHYRFLGALRARFEAFKEGEFVPISSALGCVAYERRGAEESAIVVANRNENQIVYNLDREGCVALRGGEVSGRELRLEGNSAAVLIARRF